MNQFCIRPKKTQFLLRQKDKRQQGDVCVLHLLLFVNNSNDGIIIAEKYYRQSYERLALFFKFSFIHVHF